MRKLGNVLLALGLALVLPAMASAINDLGDEAYDGTPIPGGGGTRTNDCPGAIVWDTGMFDDFTPPTGCATAGSAGCFVNAINDGGFPPDGRRMADDWISDGQPITAVKTWARYSASGYEYRLANPGSLHGFCVKFYEALDDPPYCPDGSIEGEEAIGAIVYNEYCTNFTEFEITTGLPRNFNVCVNLDTPFFPTNGRVYWVSVSADFDFTTQGTGVTQWFNRMYEGLGYNPYCEASWWDTWNDPATNWINISTGIVQPCWAGWDIGFVLYSGTVTQTGACCLPGGDCVVTTQADCQGVYQGDGTDCDPNPCPTPTEEKSWGAIKNSFR